MFDHLQIRIVTTQPKTTYEKVVQFSSHGSHVEVSLPIYVHGAFSSSTMDDFHSENDLDNICERLKITDLENEEIVVEFSLVAEVVDSGKNCLLLKLLTSKFYNCETFKATMRNMWRSTKSICFHDMGEGLLIAEFELHSDKISVTCDGPWSFDKNLILMKDFDGLQQVKNIKMV